MCLLLLVCCCVIVSISTANNAFPLLLLAFPQPYRLKLPINNGSIVSEYSMECGVLFYRELWWKYCILPIFTQFFFLRRTLLLSIHTTYLQLLQKVNLNLKQAEKLHIVTLILENELHFHQQVTVTIHL